MTDTPALQARALRFGYRPGRDVLRGVDLDVCPGRLLCLLGPNGSGKTTLLRCLLGLLRPAGGSVLLGGRPLERYRQREQSRRMAYVPQNPSVSFAFTVREIVLLGRFAHAGALGLADREDLRIARQALQTTGTEDLADRCLGELSGGQAQCVMIARALAQQPEVLLLDEPTSQLDVGNQVRIYRLLRQLAREQNRALVCVSHDINLAARFADELALLGEGAIARLGPPKEVIRRELLQEVYGTAVRLIDVPDRAVPLVEAE